MFSMDSGLRLIPLASLYEDTENDSRKYLIEDHSFSIIPNFRSTDIRYKNLKEAQVLAMGASDFGSDSSLSSLPSVPVELEIITKPTEKSFLNQDFTLNTLKAKRRQYPFQIVHLATHADFSPGDPGNSSIQLGDTKLRLNPVQLRLLQWGDPPVDLLVLSACRTALGSKEAELGFSGLSLQSGVKSTLASLWYVSDLGSLALMNEFYKQLRSGKTKAEALREAQKILLDNSKALQSLIEIRQAIHKFLDPRRKNEQSYTLSEGTQTRLGEIEKGLESDKQLKAVAEQLSSPFYWAAFTIVGSPW